MQDNNLNDLRRRIDDIDQNIYQLIKERAQIAIQVANIKQLNEANPDYYRPEREAQILRKVIAQNDSPLPDHTIGQIFREIITACLALQKQFTIAYLGPPGTFSQMAAETHFGKYANTLPLENISRIFREVEADNVNYGIVPIENSTAGTINITLDEFLNSNLYICGEVELPIHQFLMSKSTQLDSIQKIYAHEQSIAQCRTWLYEQLPTAEIIEVCSNGLAAQLASQESNSAALGPQIAADLYRLNIIKYNIEDSNLNKTRFVIIGKQFVAPSGNDKTSILISSPHSPGSLYALIYPFAKHNVNLTLIESRPYAHRNWQYVFFIDLEGHQQDENVMLALEELKQMPVMLTILGSYPRAI